MGTNFLSVESHTHCPGVLTFGIITHPTPSASLDNAYFHKNNKRSKHLLSDATLHHNECIDNKSFKYLAAFAHAWQIHIADR